VYLPAGTVHGVSGGVLMAEVQQTSDATFRLFDWGRNRPLHVEEALESVHWGQGAVEPIHVAAFNESGPEAAARTVQSLANCKYFDLHYEQIRSPVSIDTKGQMQVRVILKGTGTFFGDDGAEEIRAGQAWLFPSGAAPVECRPSHTLKTLLCSLP
jgi:mannose-6-phosphate isomerase